MELKDSVKLRRDTRHFLCEDVPEEVLTKALDFAHMAPSVGLSEPWRFVVVESPELKLEIKKNFDQSREEAEKSLSSDQERLTLHKTLKLEAIETAPVGLAVFSAQPGDEYILGTSTKKETLNWSVACAIQNLWLSLTEDGYSLGWVSIIDYDWFQKLLDVPKEWLPLGYLCIGKPADNYDSQPMLQQKGWKNKSEKPTVLRR
ncbi:5,6-dimethylbenzimidazole synthase [bacterium]|nr:5,6-dimethylbenzimidazole synthase [bacterium]